MATSEIGKVEVVFHGKDKEPRGRVSFDGLDMSDPHRVRALMDLLKLPEGTNATVLATASSSIVR